MTATREHGLKVLKSLRKRGMTAETAMGWRKRALSRADFFRKQSADARAYATWLARRDGFAVPQSACRVEYANYAGDERPRAVIWYNENREYNRNGSYTVNKELLRIDIPHWNWSPSPPVEEQLPLGTAA